MGSLTTLQFPVLIVAQFQPDPAAALFDALLQGLTALQVQLVAAALGDFEKPVLAHQVEPSGQWRFEVLFQELTVPAALGLEVHIDSVAGRGGVPALAAQLLAGGVRSGQGVPATAADLTGQTHSRAGRTFTAHKESIGE